MSTIELNNANAVLLGKVAIPAFFQKLANDYNMPVRTQQDREVFVNLADIVRLTIDNYLSQCQKGAVKQANDWFDVAIKSLADIAAAAEGFNSADQMIQLAVKKAKDEKTAETLLQDPDVVQAVNTLAKTAAGDYIDNLLHDLEQADRMTSGAPSRKSKRDDEDEDEEDED